MVRRGRRSSSTPHRERFGVWVDSDDVTNLLQGNSPRELVACSFFSFVSSSCSYSTIATAKNLFRNAVAVDVPADRFDQDSETDGQAVQFSETRLLQHREVGHPVAAAIVLELCLVSRGVGDVIVAATRRAF